MRTRLAIGISALAIAPASLALAQLAADNKIVVNGKAVQGHAKMIGDQLYIPASALKAAGAAVAVTDTKVTITWSAAGGANQTAALEGGVGDSLFNGIWRIKVESVDAFKEDDRSGWKVKVELRNGSKFDNLSLSGSGFDSLQMYMDDGNPLGVYNSNDLITPGLLQGAPLEVTLVFYDEVGGRKPDRLILKLEPNAETKSYLHGSGADYSTPNPSFRVNLKPKGYGT